MVSVVIPCYRDSKTLSLAIDSLFRQTYKNIEIIIVNDASPESEQIEKILERYPSITYLKNEVNLGLAASRNSGLRKAGGEFIAFLDADDEYHPQKIELQMMCVGQNIAVACDVEEFIADSPLLRVFGEVREREIEAVRGSLKFSFQNFLTGASLLAPKSLLLKVDGYDESLRSCEDYDLWLRLHEEGVKLIHLRMPLYYYRFNTGGLSKNVNAISYWELEVVKRHFQRNRKRFQFILLEYLIWTAWLFRHLVRASIAGNDELRLQTLENAKSSSAPHLLYYPIKLIDVLGIPGVLQWIFGVGVRYTNKNKANKKVAS